MMSTRFLFADSHRWCSPRTSLCWVKRSAEWSIRRVPKQARHVLPNC